VRGGTTLFPADRVSLLGYNLANAWSELRNRETTHWQKTMAIVRLGLGERVDSVLVTPDMGGGNVYLALRFTDIVQPILASDLSDVQLSWLAFVAMARLNEGRSLLVIDEPELHMHPHLLGGVITLLK
jgi:predicted ATPase